jgi:uroporphyrinogen decarboxylase
MLLSITHYNGGIKMKKEDMIFIKAARGERPEKTPTVIEVQMLVSPGFKKLWEQYGFGGIVNNAELCAQSTVMPIDDFGFDAAIHMSDLLYPTQGMGFKVQQGVSGPQSEHPIRTKADVDKLCVPDPEEGMPVWMNALRMAKKELDGKVPIIGWIGSPYTMASFMVEGKTPYPFVTLKKMMVTDPEILHTLLTKLTEMCIKFIPAQIEAGADVIMILDLGHFRSSPQEYQEFSFPYIKKIINATRRPDVPIFHHADGTTFLSAPFDELDVDIIGFDWTIGLTDGIKRTQARKTVLGNMNPYDLFKPDDAIERRVREIAEEGKAAPAHVFSLGGWIHGDTPFEKTKFLVDLVHSL